MMQTTATGEGVRKVYEQIVKEGRSFVINDNTLSLVHFEDGTLFVDPTTLALTVLKNGKKQSFTPKQLLALGTITGDLLANQTIVNHHILNESIQREKIAYNTLTSDQVMPNGINGSSLADNAIESRHILDGNILPAALVDQCVTTAKLATSCIDATRLASNSIMKKHFSGPIVDGDIIAPNAVATKHLSPYCIALNHLSPHCIDHTKIANAAIQLRHLSNDCVSSDALQVSAIKEKHIGNSQVASSHLKPSCVSSEKIINEAVTLEKLSRDLRAFISSCIVSDAQDNVRIKSLITNSASIDSLTAKLLSVLTNATIKGSLITEGSITAHGAINSFDRVYNANYNDLAEAYIPGEPLVAGHIASIHEDGKIYRYQPQDKAIVGVVSDMYAMCLGSTSKALEEGKKIAVGLIGKVPVLVLGEVKLGDTIVALKNGFGMVDNCPHTSFKKIGMALESNTISDLKKVLCLISP